MRMHEWLHVNKNEWKCEKNCNCIIVTTNFALKTATHSENKGVD